jgi:hypothetical protein
VSGRAGHRTRPGPATGRDAALKAELLSLIPHADDPLYVATADFLASRAEAADAGLVVAEWLRAARNSG